MLLDPASRRGLVVFDKGPREIGGRTESWFVCSFGDVIVLVEDQGEGPLDFQQIDQIHRGIVRHFFDFLIQIWPGGPNGRGKVVDGDILIEMISNVFGDSIQYFAFLRRNPVPLTDEPAVAGRFQNRIFIPDKIVYPRFQDVSIEWFLQEGVCTGFVSQLALFIQGKGRQ